MPAGTSYTFKEGMLSSIIERTEDKAYYKIRVKNQFLHAIHPVGWIKKLQLQVDEKQIKEEDIYFVIRGQWFHAPKMNTITEVYWKLSEEAEICFKLEEELSVSEHYVKCTFCASMLEDPRVLDRKGMWPLRVEFVDGMLGYGEEK